MTQMQGDPSAPSSWRLCNLPAAIKVTVSVFVLLLVAGHIASLATQIVAYADADGVPGLTYEDLRMALHGEVPLGPDRSISATVLWEEIHGNMRDSFRNLFDFEIAEEWLRRGASEETYDWPWTVRAGKPIPVPAPELLGDAAATARPGRHRTPAEIFRTNCVVCHGPGGERSGYPLGSLSLLRGYLQPPPAPQPERAPTVARLTRATHAHLLSVPVLALILAVLFHLAAWPPGSRAAQTMLTCLPMCALALDVSFTWLARATDLMVAPTLGARAFFLMAILLQSVGTLGGMWQSPGPASKGNAAAAA